MRKFTYLIPKSLDEAISMYETHPGRAKYIAGGTDVLVKIREGKEQPDYLISLKHILAQDRPLRNSDTGELYIGAFIPHRHLETDPLIRRHYPILHDAVSHIGSVQIRNVATIGGNIVNAVPSADGAIPLVVLDAKARIYGPKGLRSEELLHFFLGPGQTVLERGEILTEIVVPPMLPRTGGAYVKFGRRKAMELPLLGVGVSLSLAEDMQTCVKARIGLGVAAPTPIRAFGAEQYLRDRIVTSETLTEAGRIASEEARVRDSIRGEAWYRREMVKVLVRRMGRKSLERAAPQQKI